LQPHGVEISSNFVTKICMLINRKLYFLWHSISYSNKDHRMSIFLPFLQTTAKFGKQKRCQQPKQQLHNILPSKYRKGELLHRSKSRKPKQMWPSLSFALIVRYCMSKLVNFCEINHCTGWSKWPKFWPSFFFQYFFSKNPVPLRRFEEAPLRANSWSLTDPRLKT
jgi:hypothetical protein